MASLLNLPREVRDEIIEFVLFSVREPPENPSTAAQDRVRPEKRIRKPLVRRLDHHVVYDGGQNVPACRSLLLVNHQLSAETKAVLARYPHSYSLDVMMVNERELWPTWLSVPALSNRVDDVVATFRIFGVAATEQRVPSGFVRPDIGPPPMVWHFYSLLDHFLKNGPVAKLGAKPQDKGVTINSLTMDFVKPSGSAEYPQEDVDYRDWFEDRTSRWRDGWDNGLAAYPMRPEWLARVVQSQLEGLLGMGYHRANYGAILYERIGTIRICLEGQLVRHIELERTLAGLRFYDPYDTFGHVFNPEDRVPSFWSWKKQALLKRGEAGLPVIDADDPEPKDAI